jgi:transposase
MIKSKEIRDRLREIDSYLLDQYRLEHPRKERDYAKYEITFMNRIKKVMKQLNPIIDEATKNIKVLKKKGRHKSLSPKQKLTLILIKQLVGKSNRMMAYMIDIFSMMSRVDVSYKSVERLYSDEELYLAMSNLFALLLKKKGIEKIDACGDATGFSLTIKKHYASHVQKLKDTSKEQDVNEKKSFVYRFNIMDLSTKMYVCYGSSLKSEREAFDKAMQMLEDYEIKIDSIRLDKYYSNPCYVDLFKESKGYIIPKKNAKLGNGTPWLKTMERFLNDTLGYLAEYYKRENSESGFSGDKKLLGWKVTQKREDRIDTALFCGTIWHNLLFLFG